MAEIRPFRGVRPADALAGDLIAPPYDVLDRAEARAILAANPRSFLAVTRADATLPDETDAHSAPVYAAARANLDRMLAQGDVVQDDSPCFYLYSQTWKGRTQTGLMAACSVDEYDRGDIKKHELTRPTKEQDRVDHVSALDAQTGLVFLAFRDRFEAVRGALAQAAERAPAWSVTTDDGVTHALTVVSGATEIAALQQAFAGVPALYIADGHHRSAAASRVAAARKNAGSSGWFLAGIFPDSELQVLAYNRRVRDLAGHTPASFRAAVTERFVMTDTDQAEPPRRGTVTMYLDGQWTLLEPKPGVVPDDPVGALDVAVLQDNVLGPLLGIDNPRTDERIDFVGGIRGAAALTASVDSGAAAVAFHLYPTAMSQLFRVADADRLMPPKSTWFEPKLRGGVVAHRIV